MSLYKIGSTLKILKTASSATDVLIDEPMVEKVPGSTKVIEPKHADFLYYRARAISAGDFGPMGKDGSRGWNYNGNFDYFPWKELEASYGTFQNRNIFLDHNSESSLYSIGKIIDAVPVEDPETGEKYIELVGKIDRTLHPEIVRKIETGELNSTSMGCSVDESKCSICGHVLHSDADDKCDHLSSFGLGKKFQAEIDLPEYNIKQGEMVPAFSINSGIVFNEDSIVGVPADPSAVIKTVLSNMKSRLTKKASLSKEEQLDLASQMEKLFEKLDETTKLSLKAEFCGICPPINKEESTKESSMADKNVIPNEDTKKILSKLSALEMEQLESYVAHKTKKANEIINKEVVADASVKEENFLSKIVAKVKNSFAAELLEKKIETVAKEEMETREKGSKKEVAKKCDVPACDFKADETGRCWKHEYHAPSKESSLSAKFNEDKNNVLASTWSIYSNGNLLVEASLKDIWGSQFETLSFADQKWAISADYAKEAVARLLTDGLPKLADLWDVSNKITKTAANGEFFKASNFFVGGSDSANNWKPEDIKKWDEKDDHVVTEYTFKFPGQEDSKGQTNSSVMTVKTEYPIKRQEGSDFKGGEDSSNNYKADEVKAADEGNKGGYGHVKTEYSFKRQPGSEFKGGSDSSNNYTPEEIKKASLNKESSKSCPHCEHSYEDHKADGCIKGKNGHCEMRKQDIDSYKESSLKTAEGPELGPDGTYAKPTTGLSNKKHDYPTTPKFTDLKPGADQKGPAAPAGKDLKTEYKIDMPGQEAGQKGPAAPKPMDVKTDYSEPKPEAGKEIKTTPKNPDEKKHDKSEKEVKTDYVAEGTEVMEAEEKGSKKEAADKYKCPACSKENIDPNGGVYCPECRKTEKYKALNEEFKPKKASLNYKEANAQIKWSSMSPEAQEFIKKHTEKHIKEDGMERAQAVAAAYSEARKKGFEVPSKASSQETIMEKKAENTLGKPEEAVQDKPELSKKTVGDKAEQSAQGETEPKGTDVRKPVDEAVKKEASDKPEESVEGSTLPEGKKKYDAKPEESVQGTTLPEEGKFTSSPETSVEGDKEHKTPNLTKAPDQAVDGTTLPPQGKKDEESSEKSTHPDSKKSVGTEPDMSVNKSAATEMPTPEMHDEVKMEENHMDAPMGEHKEAPHMEEVSAFDATEKLDIGEGYSAHKDHESKEIIIEKDGKEVKRLPDGFGKEVGEVLKLMKAVLGLPAEEAKIPAAGPDIMAPEHKEEPKVEEHPALEEAHEDELGMKESSLKAKEAELLKKEAALKAKEDAAAKEEATKKFASILQARSERCRKIVAELVEKEQLSYDKNVYESELKSGAHLLDARKKAFEASIIAKQKEFLALNDDALLVMEATVKGIKAPVTETNTKKASRLFVSPQYTEQMSEDAEIKKIFDTMGDSKKRPQ